MTEDKGKNSRQWDEMKGEKGSPPSEGSVRLSILGKFLYRRLVWVFSGAVVCEILVLFSPAWFDITDEVAIQVAHAIEIAIVIAGTLMASIVAAFIGSSFRESK